MNVRLACFNFLVILLLFGLFFLFPVRGLSHDLVIDGVSTTLWGEQYFNNITITNHGRLYISPYDGTTGGWLEVYVTGSLIISNGGAMIADNAGFYGGDHGQGEGLGGGIAGGGAGYASMGNHTNGASSGGGETYGDNVSFTTEMGSGGGSGLGDSGGRGGNGGGAIEIYGKCIRIDNSSYISSNGGSGEDSLSDVNPGGGGSGGGILLSADSIILEGVLSSSGGTGGRNYGIPSDDIDGKGSFGRIKLFAFNLQVCRSTTLPITGNQIPDAFDLPTMEPSESNASPVIETYTQSTILMMPGMDYGYYFNTYVNLAPPQYGKASYYGSVKKTAENRQW